MREDRLPEPKEGEMLLRSIYLSMDATNRLRLGDWDLYMDPIREGKAMKGFTLAEVVSRHPGFPQGSLVAGLVPWSEFAISDGSGLSIVPRIPGLKLADAFGVLVIAGPTALVGLMEVGRPKPGDTVVVTAAAGAVGMLVGQSARIHGCKTIGIAGGAEKCGWLTSEFGYDHAIDYKRENVVERLRELAPPGVDVHFENVGGEMLDAGLTVMKDFGSVMICGLISTYNSAAGDRIPGPYMFRNLIMRRLRVQGFVILDYADRYPEYQQQFAQWMLQGRLKFRLDVTSGIDKALDTLKMLYTGANKGKVLVQSGADPS
ncbi:NADP-dependent oxidoreductase [Solimonas sp. SE-A11]|uniref:MDR family NADP-dependent oxidoreductase n=1 Tax=Solimonas sp. SE-A11 TaxID=3054954 RepID=UPI00259CD4D4|nr:NADP-dependent oxidoreductase [Solimonas sp. SE-A11]MDM4768809.1 NADP-dependent oxidoreductase [Solimonas sp. SE-A11]